MYFQSMRVCLACWVLVFFIAELLHAQPVVAFEISSHHGAVWRHTPKLTTRSGEALWGQELNLRFQTTGRKDWHQWQRYPAFGVSLLHFRLGEGSHGDGIGLLPNLLVPIARFRRFTTFFRLGTGLARVNKPYDYFKNPGQNAIGSHWNNVTQFRLGGELRFNDHFLLNAGAGLTHFSNGGAALPNYGINLLSGFAGFVWSPKPLRKSGFLPANSTKRADRRFGATVQTGLAIIEYAVYDGPKYPVWLGSAAGYFYFNKVNRLLLGIDYEFNEAVFQYGQHIAVFETESEARKGSTRLAIFIADEFLFGDIGIQVQSGHYLGSNYNRLVFKRNFSKLTMRYYFPRLFKTTVQPHIGISLKAHAFTAEYIAGNTGLAF